MKPDDARDILLGRTLSLPYTIHTTGGEAYQVMDHANIFIPHAYPDTLVVALPRRGLAWIGLGSIDAIRMEHEQTGPAA